jgi:hypothetical protein
VNVIHILFGTWVTTRFLELFGSTLTNDRIRSRPCSARCKFKIAGFSIAFARHRNRQKWSERSETSVSFVSASTSRRVSLYFIPKAFFIDPNFGCWVTTRRIWRSVYQTFFFIHPSRADSISVCKTKTIMWVSCLASFENLFLHNLKSPTYIHTPWNVSSSLTFAQRLVPIFVNQGNWNRPHESYQLQLN